MKLVYLLTAILAFAAAEEIADSEAAEAASIELLKEPQDTLVAAESAYNYPTNTNYAQAYAQNQKQWPQNPSNNYVPQNAYVPPQNNYVPPQNNYVPPQNNYVWQNNNVQPQNDYPKPQNDYVQPQNDYIPPQNNYVPQNAYYPSNPPQNTWTKPIYYPTTTTTTPIPVIKNELIYGDNGSYKYEYEIADGTHVGEEGYFTNPKADDESIVKKGWYSYPGPDGKIYTVTYWADHTGFHATGDHLPTPPPIPPAIQASIEQNAKEEAAKAEAEKNKPQTGYYPTDRPYYPPQPTYAPPQPTYAPPQPTYAPPQPTYYPPYNPGNYYPQQQPNQPSYGK